MPPAADAARSGRHLLTVTIAVIIDSILKVRAKKTRQLAADAFVVKLAAIPFFLVTFVLLTVVAFFGVAFARIGGFVILPFIPLGIGLTYLAMLSTSVYAWAALVQLRRDHYIGAGLVTLYAILSLLFVTDVVSGILLFAHSRRRPGRALVIVLIAFGLILVALDLFIGAWISPIAEALDAEPGETPWLTIAGSIVIGATVVGTVAWHAVRRVRLVRSPSQAGTD